MSARRFGLLLGSIAALAATASSMTFQAQLTFGSRKTQDGRIHSIFGKSQVTSFTLQAFLGKHVFAGIGYEGGKERSGKIGYYQNKAEFDLDGWELFAGIEWRAKRIAAYVRGGSGLYAYRQTIQDNPFASERPLKEMGPGALAAAGIKVFPFSFIYLTGEAKYVYLRVKPYEERVDLSGLRLLAGFGISL